MKKNIHTILNIRLPREGKKGITKKFLKFLLQYDEYHSYLEAMMTTDWRTVILREQAYIYDAFPWSRHQPKTLNQEWSYFDAKWLKVLSKSKN